MTVPKGLQFMNQPLRFFQRLTPLSALKFGAWKITGGQWTTNLRTKSGLRFSFRSNEIGRLGNNDYGVAYEVIHMEQYSFVDPPTPESVRLIVDLGGNVGFSCLYWLEKFPNARVIVFEPHPHHGKQLQENVSLNNWESRVTFHPRAAGAAAGHLQLSDRGASSSAMLKREGEATFDVDVVDLFPLIRDLKIDILKMDIEGGEYSIMSDERFRDLKVTRLIMEWHQVNSGRDDRAWCLRRLQDCNFRTDEPFTEADYGLIRAMRI
jgi:FkbM family methyltransferase